MPHITITTLNIAAASGDRAQKLLDDWIKPTSFDVYVFTETSVGEGTALIMSQFKNAGWATFQRRPTGKDRGAAIVSRIRASIPSWLPDNHPEPCRSVVLELGTSPQLQLIGMYVPNRGNDRKKTARKRQFLDYWLSYCRSGTLNTHRILLGDLNVVPSDQRPVLWPQQQFEHDWLADLDRAAGLYDAALKHSGRHESTWVSHSGEGYTYDHILPQKTLVRRVIGFRYDHAPQQDRRLTDHSALVLTIEVDSVERLTVRPLGEPNQTELF